MKHVFIVNPTSGHGKALKIVERIEEVCKDRNIEYEIHLTKSSGDATKIAKKYSFSKNIIFGL